jgi:hypothetical protein
MRTTRSRTDSPLWDRATSTSVLGRDDHAKRPGAATVSADEPGWVEASRSVGRCVPAASSGRPGVGSCRLVARRLAGVAEHDVLLVLVQEAVEGLLERSALVVLLGGGGEAVQQVVGNVDNNVWSAAAG